MKNLFVYGSLKQGFYNNRLLKNAKLIGKVRMKLPYRMVSLGAYPALLHDDKLNWISGEIYQVDKKTLNDCDMLEGHPHFYRREYNKKLQAYVYVLPKDNTKFIRQDIPSGDWVG